MHSYSQHSGIWTLPDGRTLHGYSGHAEGRNNGSMEGVKGVGPCPRGLYTIGTPFHSPHTGPYAMRLSPIEHDALGRSALEIHGDNATHNASDGCIIIPGQPNREHIGLSDSHTVNVIA